MLFREQPDRYQSIVWSALTEIPSEIEEEALRWRQSRLEEHGFPPFEEALSVYAAPSESPLDRPGATDGPAPRTPLAVIGGQEFLPAVLDSLHAAAQDGFLRQIASLANRILVADGIDTGDPEGHRKAVRKSAGYVGIAVASRSGLDPVSAGRTLEEVPLIELFREGYGAAAALQRRAGSLVRDGWASCHPEALQLLDPPLGERVAGLLKPRPLYYQVPTGDGPEGYRDFSDVREIDETGRALDLAETIGRVFVDRLHLDVSRVIGESRAGTEDPPRFSCLLLTLVAWHSVREECRLEPLPPEVVADFLRNIASRRTAPPEAPARALENLVRRLADRLDLDPSENAGVRAFGKACLQELASQCGGLDPGVPVSEREVSCLLLQGGTPHA
jgi:hypothetical protein